MASSKGAKPDDINAPKALEPGAGEDYEIGKGKPPKARQFKAGNKFGKGRPKGAKNLKTIVLEATSAKVEAKVGGKVVKMTKTELMIHQLTNKASNGDLKAIDKLLPLVERFGPQEDPEGPAPEALKADYETLRDYLKYRELFEAADEEGGND